MQASAASTKARSQCRLYLFLDLVWAGITPYLECRLSLIDYLLGRFQPPILIILPGNQSTSGIVPFKLTSTTAISGGTQQAVVILNQSCYPEHP